MAINHIETSTRKDQTMLSPSERCSAVEQFLNNQTDEEWKRLRNAILEDLPLRVIVTIEGGNYQGAAATGPVVIDVLDFDNWKACDAAHQDEAKYYADLEAEVERLQADPTATLL
jgi:hypothetical protein